jgi:rSAM/selenodomain-associated transferase 1
VLGLFARAPVAGEVKTRLSPPLSPQQAAALYEAMLLDVVEQHARAGQSDLALWYTPAASAGWFRSRVPAGWQRIAQRGDDLAERLAWAFRAHAGQGYDRIALRGTDSPTLPLERVEAAFAALDHADLALCPDADGGYNVIALRRVCDALFDLELGTESVLARTRKQAERSGLACSILPAHHDVDVFADIERMRSDLSVALTPRTLDWLRSWDRDTRAPR